LSTDPAAWFDGGNIYIKVNTAGSKLIPNNTFTWNAYPRQLTNTFQSGGSIYQSSNPLRGQLAFTGTGTTTNTEGIWTQSQIDLSSLVTGGDTFQLIFRLATDSCGGFDGWYIDDVMVYACTQYCSATCNNGGFCASTASGDGWACRCPTGWTGTTCDTDSSAPVFTTCPSDITQTTSTGVSTGVVSWTVAATDTSGVTLTSSKESGSSFDFGSTLVVITATDSYGNSANCSFVVTIVDTEPPTFTSCPNNMSTTATTGASTGVVNWTPPTAIDNVTPVPTVVTSANSGDAFPIGRTTVTCTATDGSGNKGYCSFGVVVFGMIPLSASCSFLCFLIPVFGLKIDVDAPVLQSCPDTIVASTPYRQATSVVSWIPPTATDNSGSVSLTSTHATNSAFNIGNTTVTYTATDMFGNTASCSFVVVIRGTLIHLHSSILIWHFIPFCRVPGIDTEAPYFLQCPSNFTTATDTGHANATVTWTDALASDNSGVAPSVTVSPVPNGSVLPIGSTLITYTATDASNNVGICTFMIAVVDLEGPQWLACPSNQSVAPSTSNNLTHVTWSLGQVIDNSGLSVTIVCDHQSNDTFTLGTTLVKCQATDPYSNIGWCIFSIRVVDQEAPVISGCPTNQSIVVAAGVYNSTFTWTAPTATDNSGSVSLVTSNEPGTAFRWGTHLVTYTATDDSGNIALCQFYITVVPTLPVVTMTAPSLSSLIDGVILSLGTSISLSGASLLTPVVVTVTPSLGTEARFYFVDNSSFSDVTYEGDSQWVTTSCTIRGPLGSIVSAIQTLKVQSSLIWPVTTNSSGIDIVIRESTNTAQLTSSHTTFILDCSSAAAPEALYGRLADSLDGITFYLDRTVVTSTAPSCSSLFVNSDTLFGSLATCSYTLDGIYITFGSGATVVPGTTLQFKDSILKRCPAASSTSIGMTTLVADPLDPILPLVSISGSTSVIACTSLSLTASATNVGGRASTFVWQPVDGLRTSVVISPGATYTIPYYQLPYMSNATINVTASNYLGLWSPGLYVTVSAAPASLLISLSLTSGSSIRDVVHTSDFVLTPYVTLSGCTDAMINAGAQLVYQWVSSPSLDTTFFDSTALTLKLPAGILSAGVNYTFTLTSSLGSPSLYNHDPSSTSLTVLLVVRPTPTLAIIHPGSRTLSTNSSIVLNGSSSTYGGSSALFAWSCTGADGLICKSPYYGMGALELFPAGAPTITVPATRLVPGVYTFTLQVFAMFSTDFVTSTTSVTITMVEDTNVPEVLFTSSTLNGIISADSSFQLACTLTTGMTYAWSVSSPSWSTTPSWASSLGTDYSISINSAATSSFFTAGATLTFSLSVTRTSTDSVGTATYVVYVQQPPTTGTLMVSPSSGTSLSTTFTLTATGFVDPENEGPLSYRFYRLSSTGAIVWISSLLPSTNVFSTSALPSGLPLTLGVRVYDIRGTWSKATHSISIAASTTTASSVTEYFLTRQQSLLATDDIDQLLLLVQVLIGIVDNSSNSTLGNDLRNTILETITTSVTDYSNTAAMIQSLLSLTTSILDEIHTNQALTIMTSLLKQLLSSASTSDVTQSIAFGQQLTSIINQLLASIRSIFTSSIASGSSNSGSSSSSSISRRLLAASSSTAFTDLGILVNQTLATLTIVARQGGVSVAGDTAIIEHGGVSSAIIRLKSNVDVSSATICALTLPNLVSSGVCVTLYSHQLLV
jgi:hypothetical protein